jgi:hypothetical protein
LLNDLTSTSKVARWRLFYAIVAIAIVSLENAWDAFKLAVDLAIKNQKVGTVPWYRGIALSFQFGDSLVLVNNQYGYNPVNTANRIIAQCAVVDGSPLVFKVARKVGASLAPLTAPQLAAFTTYINQMKFAGTATSIVNALPDDLALNLKIYYNPLVLTGTGESIASPGTYPVTDAINSFLTVASETNFNGDLVLNSLIDKLQTTTGVVNPIVVWAKGKNGAAPYTTFTEFYSPTSGYMVLDTINTTITYVPNV